MSAQDWDKVFSRQQWGRWPNTRFVEWFMRKFGDSPHRGAVNVLELGCGAGAQIGFLCEEGFQAYGVDGSRAALAQASANVSGGWHHERPRPVLWQHDLVTLEAPRPAVYMPPFVMVNDRAPVSDVYMEPLGYDCIIDVCTLQHLGAREAAELIVKTRRWLRPGGYLFSIFAAEGSDVDAFGDAPQPRLLLSAEIPHLFAGFELQIGLETVQPTNSRAMRRHWIIEGRLR